jgi:hypothetical protein
MSSWYAVVLAAPILRRKESPIEAFKRTAQLAESEHEKAIEKLKSTADELVAEIEKKLS